MEVVYIHSWVKLVRHLSQYLDLIIGQETMEKWLYKLKQSHEITVIDVQSHAYIIYLVYYSSIPLF